MDRRFILAIGAAALSAAPALAQAPRPSRGDPVTVVRAYYYAKQEQERRHFSRRLAGLLDAAMKKSKEINEPVSGLDFSPAVSGQDYDDNYRKSLAFKMLEKAETSARVQAKLKRFPDEKDFTSIDFALVLENKAWKIDEISNPAPGEEGWVWSELLKLGAEGK